eukprot:SAG11_NODE_2199_length_3697_cov_2.182324_3_plen_93_part_00
MRNYSELKSLTPNHLSDQRTLYPEHVDTSVAKVVTCIFCGCATVRGRSETIYLINTQLHTTSERFVRLLHVDMLSALGACTFANDIAGAWVR